MDTSTPASGKRRFRSVEEKRRILEEASASGASVAAVARKHGVNANLVFGWMRLGKAGLLDKGSTRTPLLPVKITTPTVLPDRASRPPPAIRPPRQADGFLVIEFPGGIAVRSKRLVSAVLTG
jgi:transposase-like protein